MKAKGRDPFYCDVDGCPNSSHPYTTRERLNEHIRSHHTSDRVDCEICGKQVIQSRTLTQHMKTVHKGYKPYVCEARFCGKSFTVKSSLNRHQASHHEPWTSYVFSATHYDDIFGVDVSKLRKEPHLWEAFMKLVEVSIIRNLPFSGENSAELLALSAVNVTGPEIDSIDMHPDNDVDSNEMRSPEDIEIKLYNRLVRLLRRRGPRIGRDLLGDIRAAFQDADNEHVKLVIQSNAVTGQIYGIVSKCRHPNELVLAKGLDVGGNDKLRLWIWDWERLAGLLRVSLAKLLEKDWKWLEARSETVVRWVVEVLKRQIGCKEALAPFKDERQECGERPNKLTLALRDAHSYAACCKSIASGHTHSTEESVRSAPQGRLLPDLVERNSAQEHNVAFICPLLLARLCDHVVRMGIREFRDHIRQSHPEYKWDTLIARCPESHEGNCSHDHMMHIGECIDHVRIWHPEFLSRYSGWRDFVVSWEHLQSHESLILQLFHAPLDTDLESTTEDQLAPAAEILSDLISIGECTKPKHADDRRLFALLNDISLDSEMDCEIV